MNEIAKETRKEGQETIKKTNLEELVYKELGEQELTAKELAQKMYKKRNYKNRCKAGSSTTTYRIGKYKDENSRCKVTIYKKSN